MIKGAIKNNKPFVPITVGWRLGVQEVVVLVDTGFTGELKLSPKEAEELGLQITHTEPVMLGNEKTVNMKASLALVAMENAANVVSVLVESGPPVIGVGLLKRFGYTLHANFRFDSLNLFVG